MSKQTTKTTQAIVGIITAAILLWYFFGGGLQSHVAAELQDIHSQVANDAVKQYEMARRIGTPIDICVQAGLVSASYLQAGDELNYQHWKRTERVDCASAGVPR